MQLPCSPPCDQIAALDIVVGNNGWWAECFARYSGGNIVKNQCLICLYRPMLPMLPSKAWQRICSTIVRAA
jgi:hypothetical protein